MNWVLFLHFYQPHNQRPRLLDQIVNEAYKPLLSLLEKYPKARVTLNVNACLTEQLYSRHQEVVDGLMKLIRRKQVEVVASAKHHAFLPPLPEGEILRQIRLGNETNKQILGKAMYKPRGFFPSELAYDKKVHHAAIKAGFRYLMIDEISIEGTLGKLNWEKYYKVNGTKQEILLVPANRKWSNYLKSNTKIFLDDFFWFLKEDFSNSNTTLVTANDAEIFGHHYPDRLDILERAFSDSSINFLTVTKYLKTAGKNQAKLINPVPGTWETTEEDLHPGRKQKALPYSLWQNPDNPIQVLQWELANKAISELDPKFKPDDDIGLKWHSARDHLDHGLSSCFWWWASCRPWWDPDMVCHGALQLIKAVRSSKSSSKEKLKAEEIYLEIIKKVWEWHWSGEAQRRIDEFEKKTGHGLYWERTQPPYW